MAFFDVDIEWLDTSTPSNVSNASFLSMPPAYPCYSASLDPTTRWQGTITERGLCPTAPPTACADIRESPRLLQFVLQYLRR